MSHKSLDGFKLHGVLFWNGTKHIFEEVAQLVGMDNSTWLGAKSSNSIMILKGRVDIKAVNESLSNPTKVLSGFSNSKNSMAENLIAFYLNLV